jgi:hypothetical protein
MFSTALYASTPSIAEPQAVVHLLNKLLPLLVKACFHVGLKREQLW